MEWQIKHIGIDRSEALSEFTERRVIQPLSRMADRIRHVLVKLKTDNARSADRLSGAAVQVTLHGGQVVYVDAWAGCPYGAVDQAADRVRQSVTRRVDRRSRIRHRGTQRQR